MRSNAWTGFQTVVCPVDFSAASRAALRHAAAVAVRGNARLVVLHVNDPLLTTAAAVALRDRAFARRTGVELRRFVDAVLGLRLRDRLRATTRVAVGAAADGILIAAARERADLIVMGTHGLAGAGRLFMGSTTLSVLERTRVPVLAVPSSAGRSRSKRSGWPHGPVVAAIELDQQAPEEIAVSAEVARWFGRPLVLVHVVKEFATPSWLRGSLAVRRRRLALAKDDLENLARFARPLVETHTLVVVGHPATKIAAAASAAKSELLITRLRDRREWFGARRGSVSYHVLSHAAVPVLACPPRWRPR